MAPDAQATMMFGVFLLDIDEVLAGKWGNRFLPLAGLERDFEGEVECLFHVRAPRGSDLEKPRIVEPRDAAHRLAP